MSDGVSVTGAMYSHCLHCNAALGANELLEAFPVGRRVAFDGDKGRLWVICTKCERWNLAPFESRWEAIESAERAFWSTTVRMSTDNIGLAKWRDGTTLIRVGRPMRPEFAAWRYGDQFGRRRRRTLIAGGVVAAGGVAALGGALASGVGIVVMVPAFHVLNASFIVWNARQRVIPLPHPDGGWFLPFGNPRLLAGEEGDPNWAIELGWMRRLEGPRMQFKNWFGNNSEQGRVRLTGDAARETLAKLLPRVNVGGAPASRVQDAVSLIESAGGAEGLLPWAVSQRQQWAAKQMIGDTGDIGYIPKSARLAIEMAVHEERERLAMLGELAELERAWAQAEEVARMADQLLVPPAIESRLADLQRDAGGTKPTSD